MAELQLAAFLPDLKHGEVHNPAELVPLLIHMALALGAGQLDHDAGGLPHLAPGPGAQEHQGVVCQGEALFHPGGQGRVGVEELGDAAHDLPLSSTRNQ